MIRIFLSMLASLLLFFQSCQKNLSEEDIKYIDSVMKFRAEKNDYMKNNPNSPFNIKSKVEFKELNYFDVNLDLRFKSKLYRNEKMDTVTIFGTKGEERKVVKFGYVLFNYDNVQYRLNVYKSNYNGIDYYSIWFTDKTTNKESYGVGRYLDFELNPDENFLYDIDFNYAYNPYCAYSHEYSCAIPTKEDYVDIEINAGEKIFNK